MHIQTRQRLYSIVLTIMMIITLLVPMAQNSTISAENAPVHSTFAPGSVPAGTDISRDTRTDEADIYYTIDGSDPTDNGNLYTGPIQIDADVPIKTIVQQDKLAPSDVTEFAYTVNGAEDNVKIHHIQGEGHESPMVGQVVNDVTGIVTYKYKMRGAHYFHLQTPEEDYDGNPKTSEGIVVYTGKEENAEVGDLMAVTGTVEEYYIDGYETRDKTDLSVTEINARDDRGGDIKILDRDVELPAPIKITSSDIPSRIIGDKGFDDFEPENNAIDFWESLEAMRVEIAPSQAVAPQEDGDLVVVTEEFETDTINGGLRLTEAGPDAASIQFKLFPNHGAENFAIKTGDQLTESIIGVVNYGFSNYKVYADLADLEAVYREGETKPRQTSLVKKEDRLSIASYNVENFSANTSDGETPRQKAEHIARAFVQDMDSPDIVGVIEVQDNNGQVKGPYDADASASYERLIQDIEAAGGLSYDYVNIDPEYNADGGAPYGNIRVGFLYNPERVTLPEASAGHGGPGDAVDYKGNQLTLNPGRILPEHEAFEGIRKPLAAQFEFQGESLIVIANHLNSKIGDEPTFGQHQPPVAASEALRMELAQLLNNFITHVQTENPNENIVVLGDMNDFEFSAPLDVLKGDELVNMIEHVPAEERYSYISQGNAQVLDHILVSNHLADVTEIDLLHINADFTEMHGRASDHDPVITQIDIHSKDKPSTTESSGNSDGNQANNITSERDNSAQNDGSKLSKTNTQMYIYLLMGSMLLITAGAIMMYKYRKNRIE